MASHRYHHRRTASWGRQATFEAVVTAVVVVVVIAVLLVFLFVYHDIPLRVP